MSTLPPDITMKLPHGGNIEETAKAWGCQTSDILDLSTGLHPAGSPVWLADWLKNNASLINHYPDCNAEPARTTLATFMGVNVENVLITAGAQAAIEILPQALKWKNMGIKQPCYSEPIRAAKRAGCQVTALDISATTYPDACDCVWVTSPQNPFACLDISPSPRHGVLDESYMPFEQRERLRVIPNVIRIGSMTKTFCIPGLRLGYIIAEAHFIQTLQSWLPPWATSTLAIHLLPQLLPEAHTRDQQTAHLQHKMTTLLEQHHWQVFPSSTSFVLAKPAYQLPDFASSRILVRKFDEWQSLAGWVRLGYPIQEIDWQRLHQTLQTTS